MRTKAWAALIGVMALLAANTVGAETAAYHVRGSGGKSCQAWTGYRQNSKLPGVMEGWIDGFLSAMNAVSAGEGKGPDLAPAMDDDAVAAWVDTYCQNHPKERLANAALTLASERATAH